ncbi:MAG: pilus assembly protein TadG-related protein [Chloroflexota bacterium]|nr:pilus assembly protein TadG-related protein [Chloroflexota bacterium]
MRSRLRHKHPAQIAVITPLAIIAFVGLLGLVVDIGVFRLIDGELENAADAAALAAAWYDPVCPYTPDIDPRCAADNQPGMALRVAQQFASYNTGLAGALCGSPLPRLDDNSVRVHSIQSPKTTGVTVILQCRAGYLAGRVLGLGSTDITRWGTAAIGERQPGGTMGPYVVYVDTTSPPLIAGLVPQ